MRKAKYAWVLLACMGQAVTAQDLKVAGLKTEHLECPMGVDTASPRLMWHMVSDRKGARQQSYRLVVGLDSAQVAAGEGDAWDTGVMASDRISARYDGKPLKPRTRYYWQVAVTDETGRKALSSVAYFETGKMGMDAWQGNWICDSRDCHHQPAPYFR